MEAWRSDLSQFDADPDGADWLFEQLDGQPMTYRTYALEYWEREIDLAAISHVYRPEPLSREVLATLNPNLSLSEIAGDLYEIGYLASE